MHTQYQDRTAKASSGDRPVAGKTIGTKVGAPCGRVSLVGAADVARAVAAVLRSALLRSREP